MLTNLNWYLAAMKALSFALVPNTKHDVEQLVQLAGLDVHGSPFLNDSDRFPHVTLSMGSVRDVQIAGLVKHFKPIDCLVQFNSFTLLDKTNSPINWLDVVLDKNVKDLHQSYENEFARVRTNEVAPSHFVAPDRLTGREIDYVAHFENFANERYRPHITLGYGDLAQKSTPDEMLMSVGLFQLGPSCTCAKRLC